MLLALFFFNWRIIVLQCYVDFFCTTAWISHKYLYIYIYIYLYTCVCVCVCVYIYVLCCAESLSRVWLFATLWTVALQAPLSMGILQARTHGVGCHSLLQGIFPTQGWNAGRPHCRRILYCLSHQGRPRTLGWAACPFSMGPSWPRNQAVISYIACEFFTSWATRKAWIYIHMCIYRLEPPSWAFLPFPHLTPLGHHKAPGWAPYVILCF